MIHDTILREISYNLINKNEKAHFWEKKQALSIS
jgi:hypothetical protein